MPYKELSETNFSEGLYTMFQYVAEIVPIFFPLLLFCIFIVFSVSSFLIQKQQTGRSNFFSSMVVAGYLTTIISFVMNLIPGLINPIVPVICLVVSMIMTLIFFVSKRKNI